jgi:hypothetical protein
LLLILIGMPSLLLYGAIWTAVLLAIYYRSSKSKLPFPPGPRKLPLVGNLFDMPPELEWKTYMRWSKQYSATCTPVVSMLIR